MKMFDIAAPEVAKTAGGVPWLWIACAVVLAAAVLVIAVKMKKK